MSLTPLSPKGADSGNLIKIGNREDLIFILSEASTLEHMVMCEYLFAAFSLKRSSDEGLNKEQLKAVSRWERAITEVAVQEMLHLSLVNNMLTAIGAAPYFGRPNFPQPSDYFPPNIRLALLPFGEEALRHFLYLERPDGMAIEGVPGFEAIGALAENEGGRESFRSSSTSPRSVISIAVSSRDSLSWWPSMAKSESLSVEGEGKQRRSISDGPSSLRSPTYGQPLGQ